MALSFHCPRCQTRLPFAADMLGQHVACPACHTQFPLTPAYLQQSDEGSPSAATFDSTPPLPPPVQNATKYPPGKNPEMYPPAASPPPGAPNNPAMYPPAVPKSPQTAGGTLLAEPPRAVAHPPSAKLLPAQVPSHAPSKALIAAPVTALKPAPDGSLPKLALEQSLSKKERPQRQPPSSLAVMGALAVSIGLSFALLFFDFETTAPSGTSDSQAREKLTKFFGTEGEPLRPYQVTLRESQLAHSRGDTKAEREAYRRVLRQLRAEDRGPSSTVTGATYDDTELEEILAQLLSEIADRSFLGLN